MDVQYQTCDRNSSRVWTLADYANTTLDESNKINDISTGHQGAVTYDKNLALMQANANNEVKELQRRARGRVAYNTDSCMVQPLYPKWNAENAYSCASRQCELPLLEKYSSGAYTQLPGNNELESCELPVTLQQIPEIPRYTEKLAKKSLKIRTSPKNIVNTLRGIVYDLKHWKQLPTKNNRLSTKGSTAKTLQFVFGRENRPMYLILLLSVVLLCVSIISGVASLRRRVMGGGTIRGGSMPQFVVMQPYPGMAGGSYGPRPLRSFASGRRFFH